MTITGTRKKQVAFTVKYTNRPRVFGQARHSINPTAAGLPESASAQRTARRTIDLPPKSSTQPPSCATTKQDDVFLDLIAERLDAVLTDSVVAGEIFKSRRGHKFELTGPTFTDPKYFGAGSGIALRHADTALKAGTECRH